jgi:DNA-binding CsgD family transcriptional regulator
VVALSGCTSAGAPPIATPTQVAPAPAPTTPTAAPLAGSDALSDRGSQPGASGDVIAEQDEIQAYLVAAGDTLTDIAARFGVSIDQLLKPNGTPYSSSSTGVMPGDLVTFPETGQPYSPPIVLVDTGPREHAQGEAVLDDSGAIVKYIVAEGDRGDEIGLRFGTDAKRIYHDDGDYEGRNILNWLPTLYPGDVLRFVP